MHEFIKNFSFLYLFFCNIGQWERKKKKYLGFQNCFLDTSSSWMDPEALKRVYCDLEVGEKWIASFYIKWKESEKGGIEFLHCYYNEGREKRGMCLFGCFSMTEHTSKLFYSPVQPKNNPND